MSCSVGGVVAVVCFDDVVALTSFDCVRPVFFLLDVVAAACSGGGVVAAACSGGGVVTATGSGGGMVVTATGSGGGVVTAACSGGGVVAAVDVLVGVLMMIFNACLSCIRSIKEIRNNFIKGRRKTISIQNTHQFPKWLPHDGQIALVSLKRFPVLGCFFAQDQKLFLWTSSLAHDRLVWEQPIV